MVEVVDAALDNDLLDDLLSADTRPAAEMENVLVSEAVLDDGSKEDALRAAGAEGMDDLAAHTAMMEDEEQAGASKTLHMART